jgi:hypothetical protein
MYTERIEGEGPLRVVIQCAGRKAPLAGSFVCGGRHVQFVAHPELLTTSSDVFACRPDDRLPERSATWREHLTGYNASGSNPDELLPAGQLYSPSAYGQLRRHVAPADLYILSAGWGLVRSEYLLPDYDITFSQAARPWQRRHRTRDRYEDYNHLADAPTADVEALYFFGGLDYLPLYYDLTAALPGRKVIYTAALSVPEAPGYEYIRYGSKGTNWHYRCVTDFLAGRIPR